MAAEKRRRKELALAAPGFRTAWARAEKCW
jgi:hypothetical protein